MYVQFVYVNIFGDGGSRLWLKMPVATAGQQIVVVFYPLFFLPFSALEEWAKGRRVGGPSSDPISSANKGATSSLLLSFLTQLRGHILISVDSL